MIETFYAILRLRMSSQLVDHIVRSSTVNSPGDAAYFGQNPTSPSISPPMSARRWPAPAAGRPTR
uniref:Uncharacterized protein n=1 Tax=Phenylobacterium glaciei TaxID=2803784 RepID=A0A974S8Y6_9CAUL|nr:hypothetical protein JKL49_06350 [Phenylobacterium glaciei]